MSTTFDSGFRVNSETSHPAMPPMTSGRHLLPAGSLATWQAKRVKFHIQQNLADELSTGALASIVNLSSSHFCRAFKRTFGTTVHRFIMRARIERAQQLMLTTWEPLSSIAISCGLSDQSHLTRWFRRMVGETPAAWRRARFDPAVIGDSMK